MTLDSLLVLVSTHGVKVRDKRAESVRKEVLTTYQLWRREVKTSLSIKYKGKRNTSSTPGKISGDLIRSIPTYKVTRRKIFGKHKLVEDVAVKLTSNPIHKPWGGDSYGTLLDKDHYTLHGWKERAYDKLFELISRRLYVKDIRS